MNMNGMQQSYVRKQTWIMNSFTAIFFIFHNKTQMLMPSRAGKQIATLLDY